MKSKFKNRNIIKDTLGNKGELVRDCIFKKCDFQGDEPTPNEYTDCRFEDCTFKKCDFRNIVFKNCKFSRCTFKKCDLEETYFVDCDFEYCEFKHNNCIESSWTNTILTECNFHDDDFTISSFGVCRFYGITFTNCLFGVDPADGEYINVIRCLFTSCNFVDCDTSGLLPYNTVFDQTRGIQIVSVCGSNDAYEICVIDNEGTLEYVGFSEGVRLKLKGVFKHIIKHHDLGKKDPLYIQLKLIKKLFKTL